LDIVGVTEEQLGELVEMGDCIGNVKADNRFGLPTTTDIFLCGNDQTAGAYGAQLDVGDVLINLGTAHIVYGVLEQLPSPKENLFRGEYPKGRFYAMYVDNGGAILSHLLEVIPEFESFEHIATVAKTVDTSATTFTIDDTLTTFSWSRPNATYAEKAYAVFEFLATRINEMVDMISHDVDHIYLTGGGRKNKILVDMIKQKLGKRLIELETSPLQGVGELIKENWDKK
jgi:sugar (pentulose or hexulose) kinase